MSEIYQLRNELSDLDEVVSTERLTTIILEALPAETYSTIKRQATIGLDLSLEQIQRVCIVKTISIGNSQRLSVTKKNQQSNRKGRENGRGSKARM